MALSNQQAIAAELDALSARILNAFEKRDLNGVMSVYSRDLEYTQRNGATIGWRQLANDIRKQLRSFASFKISGFREKLEVDGDHVVETATQEVVYKDRVFLAAHENVEPPPP